MFKQLANWCAHVWRGESGGGALADRTRSRSASGVTAAELLVPEVMTKIGHLELVSRSVVDGLLSGKHRSTHRGGCSEFAEHRPYASGDEIRSIDWQVYARTDRYYVRQFEEETNLQAILAVDTSASMGFGIETVDKLTYAARTAACIARLLLRQRDAIGLALLGEQGPQLIPPRQSAAQMQTLLGALAALQPAGNVPLPALIRSVIHRLKRRGMLILLSDCFGEVDELVTALRLLRARGHEVLVLQILAPEEVHFDFRHWSTFESLESATRMNLDPAAIREHYLERMGAFLQRLDHALIGIGADCLHLTTDQDLGDVLAHFLRNRAAQNRAANRNLQRLVTAN